MTTVPYIIKENSLVIVLNGKSYSVSRDSQENYDEILDAIKQKEFDQVEKLINISKRIEKFSKGNVVVDNGIVYYKEVPLHNTLTKRILRMESEGFDVNPMINFLDNLMQNPSNTSINELYDFLESGDLPITEDGHFLAYKSVNSNYKDKYTNTFDNSVGKVVEIERNRVDDNRERTCSHGLHVCSLDYLKGFHHKYNGDKLVIVKINPKDVVSIPKDYSFTKARVCRYEVIGEYEGSIEEEAFNKSVYQNSSIDSKDSEYDYIQNIVESLILEVKNELGYEFDDIDQFHLYDLDEIFDEDYKIGMSDLNPLEELEDKIEEEFDILLDLKGTDDVTSITTKINLELGIIKSSFNYSEDTHQVKDGGTFKSNNIQMNRGLGQKMNNFLSSGIYKDENGRWRDFHGRFVKNPNS